MYTELKPADYRLQQVARPANTTDHISTAGNAVPELVAPIPTREPITMQLKTAGSVTNAAIQANGNVNRSGLPTSLKSGIEQLSGYSMNDVKVHYNSPKPAQFQAHAYAHGTNIHVAPGQERHLPHEAWHVVQQKQGRVRPTMQMKGMFALNDDTGLEREADAMGERARGLGERSPIENTIVKHAPVSAGMLQMKTKLTDLRDWYNRNIVYAKDWKTWKPYLDSAYSERVKRYENQAQVRKNNNYGQLTGHDLTYAQRFEIIDRQAFDTRVKNIARALRDLSLTRDYICVVSEAGKSNFWITAKVLEQVRSLGGAPPKKIVAARAKEAGIRTRGHIATDDMGFTTGNPVGNTAVVFIDDASYSGAQLSRFINRFTGHPNGVAAGNVYVGLVARSPKASGRLNDIAGIHMLGGNPIEIKEYGSGSAPMAKYKFGQWMARREDQRGGDDSHDQGNSLKGLFYKVPDFASVYDRLLTNNNIITGYNNGRTEPYKRDLTQRTVDYNRTHQNAQKREEEIAVDIIADLVRDLGDSFINIDI